MGNCRIFIHCVFAIAFVSAVDTTLGNFDKQQLQCTIQYAVIAQQRSHCLTYFWQDLCLLLLDNAVPSLVMNFATHIGIEKCSLGQEFRGRLRKH